MCKTQGSSPITGEKESKRERKEGEKREEREKEKFIIPDTS
jgi:hypothetical protein